MLSHELLNSAVYTFLDDAPLEERRTRAVYTRRATEVRSADDLGALDPAAIQRVREEAWPVANTADEMYDALMVAGYIKETELAPALAGAAGAIGWKSRQARRRLVRSRAQGRRRGRGHRQPSRSPGPGHRQRNPEAEVERGAAALEAQGRVLRGKFSSNELQWCDRRLLARIHRYTLNKLRAEIEPVSAADFMRFLLHWQHVAARTR